MEFSIEKRSTVEYQSASTPTGSGNLLDIRSKGVGTFIDSAVASRSDFVDGDGLRTPALSEAAVSTSVVVGPVGNEDRTEGLTK